MLRVSAPTDGMLCWLQCFLLWGISPLVSIVDLSIYLSLNLQEVIFQKRMMSDYQGWRLPTVGTVLTPESLMTLITPTWQLK